MTFHRITRTRITALALAAALALSACDDVALPDAPPSGPITTLASGEPVNSAPLESDLDTAATETDSAVTDGAVTETDSAVTDSATTEGALEAEATQDDVQDIARGGDCLVGSWVFTTAEIDEYYNQLEADGVTFDLTGDVRVDLRADNTFTYTPTFGFTMTIDGMAATGQSSGAAVGTYTAEDGIFTLQATDDNTDFSVNFSGITMSASDLGVELVGMSQIGTEYGCDNGVPVFQYQTLDGTHPVSFERA